MDFDKLETFDGGVLLKNVKNFELKHIFECGQCFRWTKQENDNFIGIAFGKVIEVEKRNNDVIIYNTDENEFNDIWLDYFDLNKDYTSIKEKLSVDPLLKQAVEFGHGIRLLKQEPFEIIISFIISSNNRIPMIKKVIGNICRNWGKPIIYKGENYYSFPSVEALSNLSVEDYEKCSTGFRGKYIKDTVDKICSCVCDVNDIVNKDDDACHIELQKLSGIGPKVADCIMLFSMGKYSAFPVDVWVKRAMQYFYLAPDVSLIKIRNFAREKFGDLSGFAQQYLFYYARENKITV
jgi:N-glycosylase/DNA lyase